MGNISMETIVQLVSGLALFLYGMKIMSENLEAIAGDKMKKIVELFTSTPIIGVFVGTFVTAIIQSSSATTVMVIGFVNAGLMNLFQAIGIIMGANIGTTITTQIVSFNLSAIAPYAIIIGSFGLLLMNKKNDRQNHFLIILGFGILFLGMNVMSTSMKPLRDAPEFVRIIQELSKPGIGNAITGLAIGAGFTALIQSSSAVTTIIVAMASAGTIGIEASFPMLLGANIGTTITAILSAIGANKTAKKASLIHLLFNLFGSLLFLIIFIAFRDYSLFIMTKLGGSVERQIANTHTIFNVINTIILLPFSKKIIQLVNLIIPGEDEELVDVRLDERMTETPSLALQVAKSEIDRMGELATESYVSAMKSYINRDIEAAKKVFSIEKKINAMERGIADFMLKIPISALTSAQVSFIDNMFNIINDIERVGDHADNIAELATHIINEKIETSELAIHQMIEMSDKVKKSLDQTLKALADENKFLAKKVVKREFKVDQLEKSMRKEHIKRLQEGLCKPAAGVIFLDVISNLERIGDHASNISNYVLDIKED